MTEEQKARNEACIKIIDNNTEMRLDISNLYEAWDAAKHYFSSLAGEFDEKASIEKACKGLYLNDRDRELMESDNRLSIERLAFINGERNMHSQMSASLIAMKSEIERLKGHFDNCSSEKIVTLNLENTRLREALEFYADSKNWMRSWITNGEDIKPAAWADKLKVEDCALLNCGGGRARKALSGKES